jgi:hypothetical protein
MTKYFIIAEMAAQMVLINSYQIFHISEKMTKNCENDNEITVKERQITFELFSNTIQMFWYLSAKW